MVVSIKEIEKIIYDDKEGDIIGNIYKKILSVSKSKNSSIVNIVDSKFGGTPAAFKFSIEREKWVPTLEICLKICSKEEKYEECAEIRDLINTLKNL